eukprot:m.51890 g.51890  ORF g.51890 m.51890 type:complete len:80 (+) comp15377_c1_seq53:3027-3266(+)
MFYFMKVRSSIRPRKRKMSLFTAKASALQCNKKSDKTGRDVSNFATFTFCNLLIYKRRTFCESTDLIQGFALAHNDKAQ